ncbi:hypothetical protein RLEG12_30195 [Rhizobium leguminosarum bv. trifolii CB782]|nr:hypothetical protein RLEG12_30195 [Rhizobium leguminosarum bv. trifolii CB782]
MKYRAARLSVFGAGVKVDTLRRALWRAGAKPGFIILLQMRRCFD